MRVKKMANKWQVGDVPG